MSTLLHFLLNDAELQIKILFSRRTDVDYGDFETIDANEAEDSLRLAEEVMENIEKLRKEFVAQM